jgi:pimeloyl-ACP methyl ester carboxylesterase
MPFAHLKTGRFHYEVFGDKQLPAVLLIMGLGMPAAGWPQSFISMLLEKSLRVITVDNRDAGLSEHFSHLKTSMSVPAAIGCRSRRPTFSKIWPST